MTEMPFVTATQLAERLSVRRKTLLDHLINVYPQQLGIPRCPHLKLGSEIYFSPPKIKRWLEDYGSDAGPA